MTERPSHDEVVPLEVDETIPPRPEEEIADALRAEPGAPAPTATPQRGPDSVPDDGRG